MARSGLARLAGPDAVSRHHCDQKKNNVDAEKTYTVKDVLRGEYGPHLLIAP